jgi:hypothetical protein
MLLTTLRATAECSVASELRLPSAVEPLRAARPSRTRTDRSMKPASVIVRITIQYDQRIAAGPCGPAPRTTIRARRRTRATRAIARRPDRIGSPATVFGAPRCARRGAPPASLSFAERDATPPPRGAPVRRARASSSRALARKIGACGRPPWRCRGAAGAASGARGHAGFGRGCRARVVPARRSSLAPRRSQGVRSPNGRRTGRRSRNTAAIRRTSRRDGSQIGCGLRSPPVLLREPLRAPPGGWSTPVRPTYGSGRWHPFGPPGGRTTAHPVKRRAPAQLDNRRRPHVACSR